MSRFRIFVLLAAVAALATAFAACGGGDDSSSEDPQKVIENATLEGVDSGKLDMSLNVNVAGDEGGEIDVSLSGPFQSQGNEDLPLVDFDLSADGNVNNEDVEFEGGLTLLADRAYVEFEGTNYEVDPTTFGFVKSAFEQAQEQGNEETGNVTACQEAAEGIQFRDIVENLESEGGEEVEGTETTKVSGNLDAGGAIDAIIQLAEDPACASQLEAAGELPIDELEEARDEVQSAVKNAHVDVYVGDDDIVRRFTGELTIEPKGSDEKVEIDFDLTLSGVNEKQEIAAPGNAKPLEDLFGELGVNPLELFEGGTGGLEGMLEGLLEGDTGGSGGGGSSGGGSSSGSGSLDESKAYLECLENVESAADLQKCANLAP